MKKGFTLIELLAVIVILAIIALIATPIILGIINDAKVESNERSVELYVKAAELAVARKNMTEEFRPTSCTVENGVCTCDGETLNVDVENGSNINGTITFNEKGVVTGNTLKVGGEVEKEKFLYQWYIGSYQHGPSVGETINFDYYPETYGFIYSENAPENQKCYDKFKLVDNVVTEGYSCAVLNGTEVCIRGGKDSNENTFYELNRGKLSSIKGSQGITCDVESSNPSCGDGTVTLYAFTDGYVSTSLGSSACSVDETGSSKCDAD